MRPTAALSILLALLALTTPACSESGTAGGAEVTRAEYGDAQWPFTIETGTLRCTNGVFVTLEHNRLQYPLNGAARTAMKQQPQLGFRDAQEVLKPAGSWSLQPFIERGLALCKEGVQ